ncbi:MAG: hypothetical protein ABUM51_06220, partial [Bacteroidota bacterium]
NFSSLKKRIIMMNKIKSAKMHLLKFLFIVPLLAVLLLAFRERIHAVRNIPSVASVKGAGGKDVVIPMNAEILQPLVNGATGKDILANLRRDTLPGLRRDTDKSRKDTLSKRADSAKPLYVVNGVVMKNLRTGEIAPNDIKSIDILKGEAAIEAYGTAGRNGVVRITTKDKNVLPRDVEYILDGIETPVEQIKAISPSDIESINVIKGDSALQQYGERARNGVILIQTRQKKTVKEEKLIIVDGKNDDRMTIRADSIDFDPSKDPQKNYVCFVNGHRAPAAISARDLIHQPDLVMMECTEKDAILKKYGLETNQTILNVVTRGSRDNPAAYMLYRLNQ